MGIVEILTSEEALLEQVQVIERAGRTCYESYRKRDMNIDSGKDFIKKIIKRGHESVIEHSMLSVLFKGFSRGFTHQVVRHRLCAFSQRSTRYVDESDFGFVRPKGWEDKVIECSIDGKYMDLHLDEIEKFMRSVYDGLLKDGAKKDYARQYLPIGVESEIVVSANFREWRHIFKQRLSKRAHWEIRDAMTQVIGKVRNICSPVFDDIEVHGG